MIEKIKLGLWDFFVSILSGYAIVSSILIHCLLKDVVTWKTIFDSSTVLIAVAGLLTILLAGLLFEPLANYVTKLLTTCPWLYSKEYGFKNWDNNIESLKNKARQYIPNGIEESTYQYCKNWIDQNAPDDSYMPFLAKFGFYRSMSLLVALNAISIPFIYELTLRNIIIVLSSMLLLALVYYRRSSDFYRHISVTIYSRFISSFNTKPKLN